MPVVVLCVLLSVFVQGSALAEEAAGAPRVVTLPSAPGHHWFWMSDVILHRTALFDADSASLLGTISSGSAGAGFVIAPLFAPDHREIYLAETYYARGVRGERTDVVTVYDAATLQPVTEIAIPPKRAEYFPGVAANALSDDGRFMAVFNLTPAQSLSIVDVKARRFTTEVSTPGCSLAYAAGDRRFLMLCADGAALRVALDDEGQARSVERTATFFDPQKDPVTEKAVRRGNEWFFVSNDGIVHPVDVGGDLPRFEETWPLLDDEDRRANWRIGGAQHLALHARSGRLYSLVHQGGPDSHKDAGSEIWVYDLATRRRVQRIAVLNPLVSFIHGEAKLGRASSWLLEHLLPNPGVDRILVTQDERPVLVAAGMIPPTVTVHDAGTGEVVHEISEVGIGSGLLAAP
jgi:methylamine dehydrogenase heavy chain